MTLTEHDQQCTALFRKLEALKLTGADKVKGREYDDVLRELQTATRARLGAAGLGQVAL